MSEVTVQKVSKVEDRTLPVFREMEELMQRIRARAFDLFSGRALGEYAGALDHWLAAERELCWAAGELVEEDKRFLLKLAVPGFEPAEISVTATPRELIVHAKRATGRTEEQSKKEDGVHWSEFRGAEVYRRVELPREVLVEKVSASLKNGILKVVAAKADRPTLVEVKVEAPPKVAPQVAAPAMQVPVAPAAPPTGAHRRDEQPLRHHN